jgi:hypothetical protein
VTPGRGGRLEGVGGAREHRHEAIGGAPQRQPLERRGRGDRGDAVAGDRGAGPPVDPPPRRQHRGARGGAGLDHRRDQQLVAEQEHRVVAAGVGVDEAARARDRRAVGAGRERQRPQQRVEVEVQPRVGAVDVERRRRVQRGVPRVVRRAAAAELHDRAERRVLRPPAQHLGGRRALAVAADVRAEERVARHRQRQPAGDRRGQAADVALALAVVDAVAREVAVEIARPDAGVAILIAPRAGAGDEEAVARRQRAEVGVVVVAREDAVQVLVVAAGQLHRQLDAVQRRHHVLAVVELEAADPAGHRARDALAPCGVGGAVVVDGGAGRSSRYGVDHTTTR